MLRLLKYLAALTALLACLLPLVFVAGGLQAEPLVPLGESLAPADIARAQTLIRDYVSEAKGARKLRSLEVPERDLALVLDYLVRQRLPGSATVNLHEGSVSVLLTVQAPQNPLGRYFNLRLDLAQAPNGIDVTGLRFGDLVVPSVLTRRIGWLVDKSLRSNSAFQAMLAGIDGYELTEDRLVVRYQRPLRMTAGGQALPIEQAERARLLAYSARIAATTRKDSVTGKMPLTDLLGPVFAEARKRTRTKGEAAVENRAALVTLLLYVQRVDVASLLGAPPDSRYRGKARRLTLRGRVDLAKHFVVSAGIAAGGGSALADAAGLFKELDDSRGGSGFSFTDLAADRAGVRFAETATGSDAMRIQGMLAEHPTESLFMPEVQDLPEFLPEEEFLQRFGGVGAPGYKQVETDIERRIAALPIYRESR